MFRKVSKTLGTALQTLVLASGCRCDSAATWTQEIYSPPANQQSNPLKHQLSFAPRQETLGDTFEQLGSSGVVAPITTTVLVKRDWKLPLVLGIEALITISALILTSSLDGLWFRLQS